MSNKSHAYFKRIATVGIPFMDNRTPGTIRDLVGEVLHIVDFGFIRKDRNTEYVVIAFEEYPDKFFFGGIALTNLCAQVDADGMREELAAEPLVLNMDTTRSGNEVMTVTFPDAH